MVPDDPIPPGMITVDAADTWGSANSLEHFKVVSKSSSQGTLYANVFIFHGGKLERVLGPLTEKQQQCVSGDVYL